MIHGDLQNLADLLLVRKTGEEFTGGHPREDRYRVYGGQLLGQGLVAACWDESRPVRSLHATFVRAGDLDTPIQYRVQAEAHSADDEPCLRSVTARQHERVLFLMDVLLDNYVPAANPGPVDTSPAQAIPRAQGIAGLDADTQASWAVLDSPFDNRFVENVWAHDYREPAHQVWFRGRGDAREPDAGVTGAQLNQAMLAYYSDDTIMDNALFPYGWLTSWHTMTTASLDHCMWFHDDFSFNEWLLHQQDSPTASAARGMTRGIIRRADGTLVASVLQEIFMRPAADGACAS